jgi:adenylate cyclase
MSETRSRTGAAVAPNLSSSGQCVAVGAVPALATPLIEAMRAAGLPD